MTLFSGEANNRVVGFCLLLWSLLEAMSNTTVEAQSSRLQLDMVSDRAYHLLLIRRDLKFITMALQQRVLIRPLLYFLRPEQRKP